MTHVNCNNLASSFSLFQNKKILGEKNMWTLFNKKKLNVKYIKLYILDVNKSHKIVLEIIKLKKKIFNKKIVKKKLTKGH